MNREIDKIVERISNLSKEDKATIERQQGEIEDLKKRVVYLERRLRDIEYSPVCGGVKKVLTTDSYYGLIVR